MNVTNLSQYNEDFGASPYFLRFPFTLLFPLLLLSKFSLQFYFALVSPFPIISPLPLSSYFFPLLKIDIKIKLKMEISGI